MEAKELCNRIGGAKFYNDSPDVDDFEKGNGLEELTEEITELGNERGLRETELKQNVCRGNKDAYYLSEINLNEKIIEKTKIVLDDCYQKLNLSFCNILNSSISRFFKGYGKLMNETKKEQENSKDQLKKFERKFYESFCKPRHQIVNKNI